MTRERFKELQLMALDSLKADMEEHRKNPMLLDGMREEMDSQYQAILQMQAEWERGGFWTPENEKKYREVYKDKAE